MLRPRIQAPTFAKPAAANSSSAPVEPPGLPTIAWNVRVGNIHSCSASPPTPSGFSRLWSGPAPKPSAETLKQATLRLDIDRSPFYGSDHSGLFLRPHPGMDIGAL